MGSQAGTAASTVTVRVLLFGIYRQFAGRPELLIDLPMGSDIAVLISELRALPELDRLPERPAVARNLSYASPDEALAPGDEVALIPPLAGG